MTASSATQRAPHRDSASSEGADEVSFPPDRISELYHRQIWDVSTQEIARARIHWMCSMARGTRVLDVGCSQGIASILLAREGFGVVGIDSSPQAIRYALDEREREVAAVKSRLSFVEIDLKTFAEAGFDTLLLGEVIEHQVNPRRFIELCAGKVAPDGVLVLTTPFGLHPHPDHKVTLFPRDVVEAIRQGFEVETLDVVDGYIRCTAIRRQAKGRRGGGAPDGALLRLTESATLASQDRLRALLDRRRDLIEAKRAALAQAQAQALQLGQTLAQAQLELATAQEEAQARAREAEAGRAELERLRAQLDQAERTIEAERANAELERAARSAGEAETAAAERSLADATARAETGERAAEAAWHEADAAAAQAAEATAKRHVAERQRDELERRVAVLEAQIERLETAGRDSERAAAEAAERARAAEAVVGEQVAALADAARRRARSKARQAELGRAVRRLRRALRAATRDAEAARAGQLAGERERQHLRAAAAAAAAASEDSRRRAAEATAAVADREAELRAAQESASEARARLLVAEQREPALAARLAESEARADAFARRIDELSREAEHARAEVERLGAERERSAAALKAEHQRALREVELQLRNGRSDTGQLRTEVDRLRKALALTEQKADNIRRTLSFRLGHLLINAPKSPRNLVRLPRQLLDLRREAKRRRLAGRGPMPDLERSLPSDPSAADLRAIYVAKGLEAALARVDASSDKPKDRARRLTDLARLLAGFDPAGARDVARRAHALDARPFRGKWLAFFLYDCGEVRAPAQLIDALPADLDLKPAERSKAAQIRGLAALLEQAPAIPARRRGASTPRPQTALYVAASALPYHISGYTTRTQSLLGAICEGGWEVSCLMRPGYPDDRPDALRAADGDQHRLGRVRYLRIKGPHVGRTALDAYLAEAAAAIEREGQKLRPAVIHAASNHVNALPALIAARRLGAPFVYEVRGLWEYTSASKQVDWEASERFQLARDLETLVAREADLVLTLTEALAGELAARGVERERIRLVPNCVDLGVFAPRARDAELAAALGLGPGALTVIYVGSVVAYEGLDDLVRAIARLAEQGIDARLVIAGQGDALETLKRLTVELKIEDRVHLVGRIAPEAAPRWLSLADAVALPRKPFKVCELVSPLKPLEAMAMARPVVVSDVRAQLELVEDGVSGLVHKAGDAADLARQLARLAADPALAQRLATNARERVTRERTWPAAATRVVDAYDALLGTNPLAASTNRTKSTLDIIPLPKGRNAFTAEQKQDFLQRLAQAYEDGGPDAVRKFVGRQAAGRPASFLSFCMINAAKECKQRQDLGAATSWFSEAAQVDPRPSTLRSVAKAVYGIADFKRAAELLDQLEQLPDGMTEADAHLASQAKARNALIGQAIRRVPNAPSIPTVPARSVYFLHNSLPHASAGYATRSHGLALAISAGGYDVRPYTRPGFPFDVRPELDSAAVSETEVIDGLIYRRLFQDRWRGTPMEVYVARASDHFETVLRKERPAIVHAASNYVTGLPAMIAARRLGLPFVYEVRGFWEITRLSRDDNFVGSTTYYHTTFFEGFVAREADHVITLTGAMRDELIGRGVDPDKITLVHNSVDPDRFQPLQRNHELAARLEFPEGVPVIGYVGSFVDYEGLDDLVRAAALLKARGVNFRLLLVGDGNVFEQVNELVASHHLGDRTVLTGRVPHEEVEAYYSLIDIVPLPRKPWPVCELVSPLKPFEALAMEKALVVPDVQALAEIVAHGETGLVYRKGDVNDLARTLIRLARDPVLTKRLGVAGRQWVVAERSWSRAGKLVVSVYDRVRAGGGSGSATERAA